MCLTEYSHRFCIINKLFNSVSGQNLLFSGFSWFYNWKTTREFAANFHWLLLLYRRYQRFAHSFNFVFRSNNDWIFSHSCNGALNSSKPKIKVIFIGIISGTLQLTQIGNFELFSETISILEFRSANTYFAHRNNEISYHKKTKCPLSFHVDFPFQVSSVPIIIIIKKYE